MPQNGNGPSHGTGAVISMRRVTGAAMTGACFNAPTMQERREQELFLNCRFKRLYRGVSRMPDTRRPWSEDDIAKLKSMAGKLSARDIAAELGRSLGATVVEASKLKISLSTRPQFGRPRRASVGASLI